MEMMFKLTRIPIIFVLAASLLYLAGCGKKEEKKEAAPVVRPVKTATVQGFSSGEYTFPGTVDAGRKLLMSFRVSGRLVELPVKEGDNVKKGQLIARLDPKDFQIALDEAKAQYDKAQADYRRYQTLYEKNAVPRADLDLYRSKRDVAKSRLDEAKANLSYTYLRAPFAGQIGNRYVENYMDVKAQDPIVDLNDNSVVEIKVNLPENLIITFKTYSKSIDIKKYAEFEVGGTVKSYPIELKEVSSRADTQTQTFQVTLQMPQPKDLTLLPGMTANVRLVFKPKKNVDIKIPITVPAIAVIGDEGSGNFVWMVDKETMTVRKQKVKVGEMRGSGEITILDGLKGGEIIVTAGLSQLEEGMKVRFWDEQDKE